MNIGRDTLRRLGILVVILHALVITLHSMAHTNLFIAMSMWQNIFIFVVILIAPIVGMFLIWRRLPSGFAVLAISMAGSFVFGVYYHFVAIGSDNVFTMPANPWAPIFQLTALLLALIELGGSIIAFLGVASSLETSQS